MLLNFIYVGELCLKVFNLQCELLISSQFFSHFVLAFIAFAFLFSSLSVTFHLDYCACIISTKGYYAMSAAHTNGVLYSNEFYSF